jgi:dipeptide/tripeptide permease
MEDTPKTTQPRQSKRRQRLVQIGILVAILIVFFALYDQLKDFGAALYQFFNP